MISCINKLTSLDYIQIYHNLHCWERFWLFGSSRQNIPTPQNCQVTGKVQVTSETHILGFMAHIIQKKKWFMEFILVQKTLKPMHIFS